MQPRPKTIQIFLPDGNARSIRIAEITSRTVQAIQIPRSKLSEAEARMEPQGVGVYFLFGGDEESTRPKVYIGEAEDCYKRLKQHHRGKDFWNTAVAIISKTHAFTKAHAKYLEWFCYAIASKVDRYDLANSAIPSEPYISEPMQADLMDNFETMRVLLSTLGFPLFEEIARSVERTEIFYCRGRGAEARGEYVEDGFVVLKGSTAAITLTPSAEGGWVSRIRERLHRDNVLADAADSQRYVFAKDHIFNSPSGAAAAVLGRNTNGWRNWKDSQGRTLDEVKRRNDS